MKIFLIFLSILIIIELQSMGQYNNIWMLGHNYGNPSIYPRSGLDFSLGNPDTFSLFRPMPFFLTNASVCDSNGQLLFYSNGIYIANKLHDTLENSQNFNPGYNTVNNNSGLNISQAVVIFPFPGDTSKYILIHQASDTITLPNNFKKAACLTLRYSVIDMTLDSQKGGVISNKKSIILVNDTLILGKLNACKHGNGRDWWIISQRFNDSLFYKILITPDTVEVFTQQIGAAIFYDVYGQSVFSPDGLKYAILGQNHTLDIYDFDRCDGMLANHHRVSLIDTSFAYIGSSISPNGIYLYVSTPLTIYQFDLSSSNIDTTIQIVAVYDSFYAPFATLFQQHSLGLDGKIYISTWGSCYVLHTIDQPDNAGISCNVLQHNIILPQPPGNFSVPTFPNYNLGPLTGSICDTLTGINDIPPKENVSLTITPNPVTDGVLHIRYMLPQNKAGTLTVTDITGKQVYTYRLPQWSTLQNLPLWLAEGMYFCTVTSNGLKVSKKFVVIR